MHKKLRSFIVLVSVVAGLHVGSATAAIGAPNLIQLENMNAGAADWQPGGPVADDISNQIKGYASAPSVALGGAIDFKVSVNPAQLFQMRFYRMGWYQGLGARLMLIAGAINGTSQAPCIPDATTGLIDCGWSTSYQLTVPLTWTSGIYLVRMINTLGFENYIVFTVKDGRPAPLLYQQPAITYEGYNNYPNDHATGKSLYEYASYGANTIAGTTRAVRVSFNRPYNNLGVGDFLFWEVDFVRWIERSGYDVTYVTDVDTHENGSILLNSRGFLSVGHNEYWTKEMRDAVETARDAGVSLAFFGANADYRQVRFEAAADGTPDRVIVHYRDPALDPVQGPTTTTETRYAPVNRPEQPMIGIQYTSYVAWGANVDYVVANSLNDIYFGTFMLDGTHIPGIVGYEMDRQMTQYPMPVGSNYALLSQSPFTDALGGADFSNSSIYQAPSTAWVFASGTLSWSYGLDSFTGSGADTRIQRTTANLLDRFTGGTSIAGPMATANPPAAKLNIALPVPTPAD
jgi:N,N-dimethylformamidase beta subunit-like protein